jgi:hypothetical protein
MLKVLIIAVFASMACSGKQESEHKAAVDKYINVDMHTSWGVFWAAQRPFKTLKNDALDRGLHGWFEGSMGGIVIPRMTQFLEVASKVTPPEVIKAQHTKIVELATAYRDIAADMKEAAATKDTVRYKAAHEKMLSTYERYLAWQSSLDSVMKTHGVSMKDVPEPPALAAP